MAEFGLPRILQSGIAVCRGMARAGRESARAARSRYPDAIRRASAHCGASCAYGARRRLARDCLVALALCLGVAGAQAQVVSTRIWPAKDYTRVTLETKSEIKFQLFSVKDPERLVLDLEGVEIGPALAELQGKVVTG